MLAGETPTMRQIRAICDGTGVPYFALFSERFKPQPISLVDYRGPTVVAFKPGRNAKAVMRQIRLRNFFAEIYARLDIDAPQSIFGALQEENPEQFAQTFRSILQLDSFQYSNISKKSFFNLLRARVQSLGIFVVCDHNIGTDIDGIAIFHEHFTSNYIFLNTGNRNSARMSFTMCHELYHIILKQSGVSNDYQQDNNIESDCNSFAASLLLPRGPVLDIIQNNNLTFDNETSAVNSADRMALHFKTSVSAALYRVFQFGLCRASYLRNFLSRFGAEGFVDSLKDRQRGGPPEGPDQGALAIAHIGERASALFASAVAQKKTTLLELSEATGFSKNKLERMISLAVERGFKI